MSDDWGFIPILPTSDGEFLVTYLYLKYMIITKAVFWRVGFFQPIRASGKLQIALIGWIKAGPPKKATFVVSCKQAIYLHTSSGLRV